MNKGLRVKRSTLMVFTKQFASMLRSQLPLVEILENLSKDTPQKKLKLLIEVISKDVQQGIDLSQALASFPKVFDEVYLSVIRSGLASGRLADAMLQVAEYLRQSDSTSQQVRRAISYPIFIMGAFFLVFNVMVFFILPRFEAIFSSFGSKLPGPTQALLTIGSYWRDYWMWILLGIGGVLMMMLVWVSSQEGRYYWDQYKLRLPLLGNMWRMMALSRFLRTLSVQIKNEVNLLEALLLASSASGNLYIKELLVMIIRDVERGSSIAHAFRKHMVFSGIVMQMISSGEEAGTLDELLLSAAEFFEETLANQISTVVGLVNPILTLMMGLFVAGMMIASFLPIFEMGGIMKSH
ncbi:MAG: type II secretion system F family protein [Magnetococcus sp. DMHC-6]